MTVFKTFLKILRKNMAMIIVYTLILVIFGGFSMQSQDKSFTDKELLLLDEQRSGFMRWNLLLVNKL